MSKGHLGRKRSRAGLSKGHFWRKGDRARLLSGSPYWNGDVLHHLLVLKTTAGQVLNFKVTKDQVSKPGSFVLQLQTHAVMSALTRRAEPHFQVEETVHSHFCIHLGRLKLNAAFNL